MTPSFNAAADALGLSELEAFLALYAIWALACAVSGIALFCVWAATPPPAPGSVRMADVRAARAAREPLLTARSRTSK